MTPNTNAQKTVNNLFPYSLFPLFPSRKVAFTLAEGAKPHSLFGGYRKAAFTLAEVLITLGIIGVVAALTLPSLIQTHQKNVTAERLKQTYTMLTNAMRMHTAQSGVEQKDFDTTLHGEQFMKTYINPYLNVVGECRNKPDCYGNKKPLLMDKKEIVPYQYMAKLANGTYIGTYSFEQAPGMFFVVDINGATGPNLSGRDIFNFILLQKKRITNEIYKYCVMRMVDGFYPGIFDACMMPSINQTREDLLAPNKLYRPCNPNKKSDVGDGCAAVIYKDGWKISKDYPW